MATGRIGVTPTLGTRWSKAPAGGTTSLSGLDDNSVSLVYSVGYEQVYRNGVLLSRGNDYTATTGNSITLIDATIAGDIIEVFANELVPLTDAISKGQFTAKGALLSATAASTPAVLTVGSNNQVLTADSTTSTGLKWSTAADTNLNWTVVNSGGTTLNGNTTVTISSITGANYLAIYVKDLSISNSGGVTPQIRFNSDSGTNYNYFGAVMVADDPYSRAGVFSADSVLSGNRIDVVKNPTSNTSTASGYMIVSGGNSSGVKTFHSAFGTQPGNSGTGQSKFLGGYWNNSATISSVSFISDNGNFDAGTIYVWKA